MLPIAAALRAGLAAFALCGAVVAWSAPAEAGASTGTWRNGMQAGPYGPGYYGPDGRYYGPPRFYGGRRGYYGPPRYYGGRRGYYSGYGYYGVPSGYYGAPVYGRPYDD
jgi:hypothetical protein